MNLNTNNPLGLLVFVIILIVLIILAFELVDRV